MGWLGQSVNQMNMHEDTSFRFSSNFLSIRHGLTGSSLKLSTYGCSPTAAVMQSFKVQVLIAWLKMIINLKGQWGEFRAYNLNYNKQLNRITSVDGIELCVTDMRVSAIKSRLINNKQFLSDHDAMMSAIIFKTIEVNESYGEQQDNTTLTIQEYLSFSRFVWPCSSCEQ